MTAERTPWLVITLLCLVSFVAYLVRTDVTIAQESMAPALGLTMRDMGVLSAWGFQLAYALGQVPAGVLVDRFGGRVMLLVAIGGWAVASLASAAVSGTVTIAFTALLGTRVLLGLSQAITFPAIALVVAQEVPAARRVSASAFYFAASSLGSAVAPPLFAPVMVRYGWRAVFAVSAFIGVGAALVWLLRAPRRAAETTRVTLGARWRAIVALFAIPALRWLSWSYLLHSAVYFVFVFWFVRYLIDARGFGMLATGLWASVPHLMAMVSAPLLGRFIDWLGTRMSPTNARRRVAMTCLTGAAVLTLAGTRMPTAALAVITLGLAASCLLGLEAAFWTTATELAPAAPGTAGGLLNLMGNLGGVLSIWLVPVMTEQWGWTPTLSVWGVVAGVAALCWVRVEARATDP